MENSGWMNEFGLTRWYQRFYVDLEGSKVLITEVDRDVVVGYLTMGLLSKSNIAIATVGCLCNFGLPRRQVGQFDYENG